MIDILVYSLDSCGKCKYAISELNSLGLKYQRYVCEDDSKECDELEEYTKCLSYPIVKVSYKNKNNIYLASVTRESQYKDSYTIEKLSNTDTLEVYSTLEALINRIHELYKKQ